MSTTHLPSITDIATGSDDFDLLVRALQTTGLDATLPTLGTITVFAPTDAAFTQLAVDLGFTGDQGDEDAVFDFLVLALGTLGDPVQVLTDVLLYHVSPGAQSQAEIESSGTVSTALGADFTAANGELVDAEPDVLNPIIVVPDIQASNGVVQVIDRVLLPVDIPGNDKPSITEIAAGSDDFNLLVRALEVTGLLEQLPDLGDITVFAPTDAAFGQLAVDLGYGGDVTDEDAVFDFLVMALGTLGDPIEVLTDVLLYHVSSDVVTSDDLGESVTTLQGTEILPTKDGLVDAEPDIANPQIVSPDIEASNGVIQVIDRVLLPVNIDGNGRAEQILGDDGRDKLVGSRRDDEIFGFDGNDKLIGRNGDDLISAGDGNDRAYGGSGDDWIIGADGNDRAYGGRGDDGVHGGDGNDRLSGDSGDDYITGGDGKDRLFGGWGDDTLEAGAGDDQVWGGFGRDTFVFNGIEGHNTIRDFNERRDTIEINGVFSDFDDLLDSTTEVRRGTLIEADEGTIFLRGVHVDELDESDFIFA